MPFNPSAIIKNCKKWFSSKSRAGSPTTTSHVNDEGVPMISGHIVIEETPSADAQSEEMSTGIFSLPPELLAEIFIHSTSGEYRLTKFDHRSPPMNITQTCHLWREIAISTHQLWNLLRPTRDAPLNMVQLWISRVHQHPLVADLIYLDGKSDDPIKQNQVETILAVLFNPSSSLVEFSWAEMICHPIILSLRPSNFPTLQTVFWTCSDYAATHPITIQSFEHFWSIASDIPSLQRATLSRIPLVGPWNQLTELHLLRPRLQYALHALAQCVQLRKLSWVVLDATTTRLAPIVMIPNLEHLSINFRDFDDSGSILNCFTVPNIHHIMLRDGSYSVILKSLIRLLHRSNAQLQSFELYVVARDEQPSLLPFFRDPCLSSLRRFVMRKGQMLEVVWAAFSQASFLPSLEQLQLSVARDFDIEVVGSCLRAREIGGGKLARVLFFVACFCDGESEEVRNRSGIYDGCTTLHPPWDALRGKWELCTSTEAIPYGEEQSFRNGEIL